MDDEVRKQKARGVQGAARGDRIGASGYEGAIAMDVKEAVRTAKSYVADLFEGEEVADVGLEEVKFDEHQNSWVVTVGFSRPWDISRNSVVAALSAERPSRSYKVIHIADADGRVLSLSDRVLPGS